MRKNNFLPLFVILSAIISVFIGIRSHDIGRDTMMYISHFSKSNLDKNPYDGFEVGFEILMYTIAKTKFSVDFFFFVVAFLITISYLYFFHRVTCNSKKDHRVLLFDYSIFFSLLFFSSWYLTLTTNGIRQGMSIPLIYIALYFLSFNKNRFKFLIFFFLAISFHFSALLVLPFVIILRLKLNSIFIIWLLFGVFYIIGINEYLVFIISEFLNLPVYNFIKFYSLEKGQLPGTGLYEGFNSSFFIYTIFWPILLFAFVKLFNTRRFTLKIESLEKIISFYFILSLPYFIFGFGPFSNRYAFFSWFFVPVIQYNIFSLYPIDKTSKDILSVLFLFALIYFCFIQLDWINFII